MKYDFDKVIDRRNSDSLKWKCCEESHGVEVLPMWVADMDFEAPKEVIAAVTDRARHGIFGYTQIPGSYYDAVMDWMRNRNGWEIKRDWIASTPGAVPAVGLSILAYTDPGDKVVIQSPVYHPFQKIIRDNGRLPVENGLKLAEGRYRMDYDRLEQLLSGGARLLILCSPHNPVGRVWERDELERLAGVCMEHNVLIVSDEIHSDLIIKGNRHTPIAALSNEIALNTITLTSASKTFNLAGLACSNVIIPNRDLFDRFNKVLNSLWIGTPNIFGLVATEAAYRYGEAWLEQLLEYIKGNYEFLVSYIKDNAPVIDVAPLEGTYLGWLDFRGLGLPDQEIGELLLKKGKVWLDNGSKFGGGGEGFQRINLACPREILKDGLERIAKAID